MATSLHITDDLIASRIQHATNRVVLVLPGFFPPVAEAIVQAIARLSPGKVTVISDIDPEACRLGFGEFSSLEQVRLLSIMPEVCCVTNLGFASACSSRTVQHWCFPRAHDSWKRTNHQAFGQMDSSSENLLPKFPRPLGSTAQVSARWD